MDWYAPPNPRDQLMSLHSFEPTAASMLGYGPSPFAGLQTDLHPNAYPHTAYAHSQVQAAAYSLQRQQHPTFR